MRIARLIAVGRIRWLASEHLLQQLYYGRKRDKIFGAAFRKEKEGVFLGNPQFCPILTVS